MPDWKANRATSRSAGWLAKYSSRPALQSFMKTVKRLKLDATKAAELVIGTVLKLSASSIDLARSQGLIRDFDFCNFGFFLLIFDIFYN